MSLKAAGSFYIILAYTFVIDSKRLVFSRSTYKRTCYNSEREGSYSVLLSVTVPTFIPLLQ